jgi:IS5 family transposase
MCGGAFGDGRLAGTSVPSRDGWVGQGYDTRDLVAKLRARDITPHVAQNTAGRRSAIDGRTTRHVGYATSQRIRMKVEEIFGWLKTVGGLRKTRYRGLEKVDFVGYLVGAAYNLVRLARMVATPTPA